MIENIVLACVAIGFAFNFLGTIGLHRFPDVYTRMHAATKCTTFGTIFIFIGIIIYGLNNWYFQGAEFLVLAAYAFVALMAVLITNPVGAHAIARAAYKSGHEPIACVDALKKGGKK